MSDVDAPLRYANAHRERFVTELCDFVRMPSVSADPRRAGNVRECARWLADHLRMLGLDARVVKTSGHPIVMARARAELPGAPTVLIYGHYDVQPADPEKEWTSPPFAPVVRDGSLYGRGTSDDKGQMFAHVKALECWRRTSGMPVNVICLFEGEEEIGSASLQALLERHARDISADVALLSDMIMRPDGTPTITYAVRGELALELELRTADRDLHSGQFGGAVRDAAQTMVKLLAELHDPSGRCTVRGFYDNVRPLSAGERRYMSRAGPSDDAVLRAAGADAAWGEPGFSEYERTTARPSLTVNGVSAGYAGPGHKAVMPSVARAKISARLVPDQDPLVIESLLKAHVERAVPKSVRVSTQRLLAASPARLTLDGPLLTAARKACRQAFGVEPVLQRVGGTIPVVSTFQRKLRIPSVMIGFARPDDRIHAVDEHFALDNFHKGIATSIRFLGLLAGSGGARDDHRLSLSRRQGRRHYRAVGH